MSTGVAGREDALPDIGLVQRVAKGDERAFGALVEKYEHRVLNTIHRYVGRIAEADDIAQEVFLIVWNKAGSFHGTSKFSTWLYRIVVNQCLQFHRRQKPVDSLDELNPDRPPESLQVSEDPERRARTEAVRKAVAELPDRQRMALVLSHFEGRSYKEVAELMDVSVPSVESLIFRAKGALKERLISQSAVQNAE
jgi:RNA polymerase sigma-70 factor (ECF subfamily)